MVKHFSLEELDLYVSGEMTREWGEKCHEHLEHCKTCQKRLMKLADDGPFIDFIKKSLEQLNPVPVDDNWIDNYEHLSKIIK